MYESRRWKIHDAGFYQAYFKEVREVFDYKFKVKYEEGYPHELSDPYSFKTDITDFDLYLLGEEIILNLTKSTAPNWRQRTESARLNSPYGLRTLRLSCSQEFQPMDAGSYPMHNINGSGVWAFSFGIGEGEVYKYSWPGRAMSFSNRTRTPLWWNSARTRVPLFTILRSIYGTTANGWKAALIGTFRKSPVSIFELHCGSFKRDYNSDFQKRRGFMNYRQLAKKSLSTWKNGLHSRRTSSGYGTSARPSPGDIR